MWRKLYLEDEEYDNQSKIRYQLEPYIPSFAKFDQSHGKKLLEVGVGLGADHSQFAINGAECHGIDLTERAIKHTGKRSG